jgi:hypothetical protein
MAREYRRRVEPCLGGSPFRLERDQAIAFRQFSDGPLVPRLRLRNPDQLAGLPFGDRHRLSCAAAEVGG